MSNTFYITTAIDYPNGAPHMGHAYEKIVSDAYARWYTLLGKDTYFLTGTDENGQKLVKSAEEEKTNTKDFIDQNVKIFQKLCKDLDISYNDFIRTTEQRHHTVVEHVWKKLEQKGDIYFDRYSGLYCLSCEAFYTELQAPDKICPEHHAPLSLLEEEGYFFKMSAYHDWVYNMLTQNEHFIAPLFARNELIKRLESEKIKDLSITRPNKGWGIPVPGNPSFVVYTWFDALINYYSALVSKNLEQKYWPANMHVIGRDIAWFHCVIWPIMLHAADIELPKQVYIHGMVLAEDGRKMSKSLQNGVDPFDVLKICPLDSFRYFILRAIPSGGNGRFSMKDLLIRHHSELGNDFGNLLMRVVKLARKRLGDDVGPDGIKVEFEYNELFKQVSQLMEQREHNRALDRIWQELNKLNAYINDKAPWSIKDMSTDGKRFQEVIYNCLYGISCLTVLISPFLPETAQKIFQTLGTQKNLDFSYAKFTLQDPPVLFPRIEIEPQTN